MMGAADCRNEKVQTAELVTFLESCGDLKAKLVEEISASPKEIDEIENLRRLVASVSLDEGCSYLTT